MTDASSNPGIANAAKARQLIRQLPQAAVVNAIGGGTVDSEGNVWKAGVLQSDTQVAAFLPALLAIP